MKKLTFLFLLILTLPLLHAQKLKIPVDTMVVTQHNTTINDQKLAYTAVTGMQPLWDEDGNPIATLSYTYYKKSGVTDYAKRPLMISFNGGPGSASVWMQIGYTGPMQLNLDPDGYPVQPYGLHENPYSVLDVTDILYVNPVQTGYSRPLNESDKEKNNKLFFGVNADIKYLAEWLNTFVTRNERWLSPKYLIGESYGGTRVSGLALELQDKQWMYLNGVILVSPADFNSLMSDRPLASTLNFPYFTAAAWYHKVLPDALQQKTLEEILPEVEAFTLNELMPALAKGGFIGETEKNAIAQKMAYYSGLSQTFILQNNLDVPTPYFWKELLRDKSGYSTGRLDSRYLGLDKSEAGDSPDYNAEMSAWMHAFTPALNYYMAEDLNFKTDVKYNMLVPLKTWDLRDNHTRDQLRQAMANNPYLNVMFQAGYFDGATTYFKTKYMMWQMDPAGKMKDRMSFKTYECGHMMYVRQEDLRKATNDIRSFIEASKVNTKPAKY
ncbi:S10 family peptidase [Saccharicrinis sp. FJH62]|uniref:S10 family peptidase n=1 Tax=Saccharicrinis sp. FJH62 TaxID=3344657 RepID=UPI0035D4647A